MGVKNDGTVKKELFTGSEDGDALMFRGLTPEQRKVYLRAQSDHHANAAKFRQLRHTLEPEMAAGAAAAPDHKAKALAVLALRKQNFAAVESMIRGGSIKAADLPELKRRAKATTP